MDNQIIYRIFLQKKLSIEFSQQILYIYIYIYIENSSKGILL